MSGSLLRALDYNFVLQMAAAALALLWRSTAIIEWNVCNPTDLIVMLFIRTTSKIKAPLETPRNTRRNKTKKAGGLSGLFVVFYFFIAYIRLPRFSWNSEYSRRVPESFIFYIVGVCDPGSSGKHSERWYESHCYNTNAASRYVIARVKLYIVMKCRDFLPWKAHKSNRKQFLESNWRSLVVIARETRFEAINCFLKFETRIYIPTKAVQVAVLRDTAIEKDRIAD